MERAADTAVTTFVVEAARETAAEARAVAATAARAVLASLREAGIDPADIKTAGLAVAPDWEHDGNRPVRRGFTVVNRIGVAIRDLEAVGRMLDAALSAGATGLEEVEFRLADPAPAETEARRLAVADARARAETIAGAAGMRLGALIALAEGGGAMPAPLREVRLAAARLEASPPTPVLPGAIEVTISVSGEWELREA